MNVFKFFILYSVLSAFAVCTVAGQPPAEKKLFTFRVEEQKNSASEVIYKRLIFHEWEFSSAKRKDPDNKPPKADAGKNQQLEDANNDGQEPVKLDGSGSRDKDGEIVSYSWIREGEEIASEKSPTVMLPTGNHTVELKVTDDQNAEGTDNVKIKITRSGKDDGDGNDDGEGGGDDDDDDDDDGGDGEEDENKEPEAKAGDDRELTDTDNDGQESVQLDGSKSKDKDGEIVSFSWSLNGEVIATTESPVVNLPLGEHTIILKVTDDGGLTATDEVKLTVKEGPDQAPEANAGKDQIVTDNDKNWQETVELNGSGSKDKDGTIVAYRWTIDGEEVATGESPAVTLVTGVYTVLLTVTDDEGLTDSDEVQITVNQAPGEAPVADAGPDQVLTDIDGLGQMDVQLDGSGSTDPDGVETIKSYSWTLSGTEIATGATPAVSLPLGSQLIVLTVTDEDGMTDTDEVNIQISAAENEAPVANAGPDQELTDVDLNGLEVVSLDGSGSTDAEGNITTYSWSVNGEEIATGISTTAELPVGTSNIVLTVTDEAGLSGSDEVLINILAGEEGGGGGEEPGNIAPVANAGADQEMTDTDNDGQESVVLDGSASYDEDGEITAYSWSIEGAEVATGAQPTITLAPGSYAVLLTVTDNEGKTATDETMVSITEGVDTGGGEEGEPTQGAFIPNLFSPNGDQVNDRLLVHADGIASLHWRIYNRRGVLVFETKDVVEATEMGWDGRTGGEPLPEGTYVWILEASYPDGSPVLVDGEFKGNVTIIR